MRLMLLVLGGLFGSQLANAEEIDFASMKQNIQQQEYKAFFSVWNDTQSSLSCPQRVPKQQDLAMLWVYKGYVHYLQKESLENQNAWKQAFAIDLDIQLDETILDGLSENEVENVLNFFEQNRGLMESQMTIDAQIPENTGEANLFIDGKNVHVGDSMAVGEHLIQITCPQDNLQSKWIEIQGGSQFSEDWFALCPSGVDTSIEKEEDMFAMMGMGSGIDTSNIYNPAPICYPRKGFDKKSFSFSMPQFSLSDTLFTKESLVLAGGGTLLTSGIASYYLWAMPKFAAIEHARSNIDQITEAEATTLSKEFNVARWTTLALLGVGVGVSSYGTVLKVQSTGTGIVLQGRF